jgi:hypothetical protein
MRILHEIARQANVWRTTSGASSLHLRQHHHNGRLIQ